MKTLSIKSNVKLVHSSVMGNIRGREPISKWVLGIQQITKWLTIVLILSLLTDILLVSIFHFSSNYKLLSEGLIGVNGIVWIWSPELLIATFVIGMIAFVCIKQFFSMHSIIQPLGYITGVCGVCIIAFQLTSVGVSAIATQQSYLNSFGYRQTALVNHVDEMQNRNIFYGLVDSVSQTNDNFLVTINHAGYTKVITMNSDIPQKGELISVKYTSKDGVSLGTEIKRL